MAVCAGGEIPAAGSIHHQLAILLAKLAAWGRRQDIEDDLGRPAEPHTFGRYDDGPIDQDRVLHHGIEELLEACAAGTPAVALIVADNQRPGAERLAAEGAI